MVTMNRGWTGFNGFNARTLSYAAPKRRSKDEEKNAYIKNDIDIVNEFNSAYNIFCSRFKWSGEGLNNFSLGYIEKVLFYYGFCIGFIDKTYGFMILPATIKRLNYMNDPVEFNVAGNGYNADVRIEECVVIRDNILMVPPVFMMERYAEISADIGRTFENYGYGMKKPLVIATDEKNKLSNEILSTQYLNNKPYLLVDMKKSTFNEGNPPVFHNSTHNANDYNGIMMAKKSLYAEMLGKIGIDSNLLNKNSYRSEMEMDDEKNGTRLVLMQANDCRQKAAKELSELAQQEIKCENMVDIVDEKNVDESDQKGNENGQV